MQSISVSKWRCGSQLYTREKWGKGKHKGIPVMAREGCQILSLLSKVIGYKITQSALAWFIKRNWLFSDFHTHPRCPPVPRGSHKHLSSSHSKGKTLPSPAAAQSQMMSKEPLLDHGLLGMVKASWTESLHWTEGLCHCPIHLQWNASGWKEAILPKVRAFQTPGKWLCNPESHTNSYFCCFVFFFRWKR